MRAPHWRRLLSAVLVMGILAHAAAVVRHGAMVIGSISTATNAPVATNITTSVIAALEADLKVAICHPGSEASVDGRDGPARQQSDCPMCTGLACAFMLPAPQFAELLVPKSLGVTSFPEVDQRIARHRFLRPASRGPPRVV